jgi:hypothetical protein
MDSSSELFRRSLKVRCTGSLDPQCSGHYSRGNPLWDAWIKVYAEQDESLAIDGKTMCFSC